MLAAFRIAMLLWPCLLAACNADSGYVPKAVPASISAEQALRLQWRAQAISFHGIVVDEHGGAVSGASVAFGEQSLHTGISGEFTFTQLPRVNGLLTVFGANFSDEIISVNLSLIASSSVVELAPIILQAKRESQARFLFGGDIAFGRRFLDADESTLRGELPPDDPNALIKASDAEPYTRELLRWVRPYYQRADWRVVNLETPVTDNPLTPHEQKAFAFFTLPGSLKAIKWLGVDYVSLGNNHIYDYLQQGMDDTVNNLAAQNIYHSGAGHDIDEAYVAYRTQLKGSPYAFLSATSVTGSQHDISYVASNTKGGAADLSLRDKFVGSIKREVAAGCHPIVQLHTGTEYTFTPTPVARNYMNIATTKGAALVVAHHPHVAQGVSINNGVVVLHSLGNFAFDQARLETFMGLMARVDMTGGHTDAVRLIPVYLKEFKPIPVTGDLANQFLRRIGEFSLGQGAVVYPYNNQGWVALSPDDVEVKDRVVDIPITIPMSGLAIIDLRQLANSAESLSRVQADSVVGVQMGRDIMQNGDFEDWDADDITLEAPAWDLSAGSRYACLSHAHRGNSGLCMVRTQDNVAESVTAYRYRTRVMGDATDQPNKDLSLVAYLKGDNAGQVNIVSRYYASEGELTFGEESVFTDNGGTFGWKMVSATLNMPNDSKTSLIEPLGAINPRALRIFIHQRPPASGEALLAVDDVAVVNWENAVGLDAEIATPHAKDFLRVVGAAGAVVHLKLQFKTYFPDMN